MALSDVLNGINTVANAASSTANKIGGLISSTESTESHIRDINTNGFLSQTSVYAPNKFARAFDEPTYLTFRLEFNFVNNLRNLKYNQDKSTSVYYSTMYDYIPEPFLESVDYDSYKLTYNTENVNFENAKTNELGNYYSTEFYLENNLGEPGRALLLNEFKKSLKDIQDNFPYYFTSISGIDSLTRINATQGPRLAKDAKISIECMEALDLRITQLLQMYRKIVWDDVYQRWVLPDMMRYFNMRIYVSEIRLFHELKSGLKKKKHNTYDFGKTDIRNATYLPIESKLAKAMNIANNVLTSATALSGRYIGQDSGLTKALNGTSGVVNTIQNVGSAAFSAITQMCVSALNNVLPTLCFDCHMCEFDISDTFTYLNKLNSSTKGTESPRPKIDIKVGQVSEIHSYTLNNYLESNSTKNNYNFRSQNGNIIVDEAFNKPVKKYNTTSAKASYEANVANILADYGIIVEGSDNLGFSNKRYNVKKSNNQPQGLIDLRYNRNQASQAQSATALVTSALSVLSSYNVIKTKTYNATNPDPNKIAEIQASAASLIALANRVYNDKNIRSMAVSDELKSNVVDGVYIEALNKIIEDNANKNESLKLLAETIKNSMESSDYKSMSVQDLETIKTNMNRIYEELEKENNTENTESIYTDEESAAVVNNDEIKNAHENQYMTTEYNFNVNIDKIYNPEYTSMSVEDEESIKDAHGKIYKETEKTPEQRGEKIYNPEYTSMSVEDEEAIKSENDRIYSDIEKTPEQRGEKIYNPEYTSMSIEDEESIKDAHGKIYQDGLYSEAVQDKDDIKNGHSDIYEEGLISEAVEDKDDIKSSHTKIYKETEKTPEQRGEKIYNPEYTSMSIEDEESIKSSHSDIYEDGLISEAVLDKETVKASHKDIYEEGLISEAVQDKDDIKNGHSDIYEEGLISEAVQDKESVKSSHSDIYKEGLISEAVLDKETVKASHKDIYEEGLISEAVQDKESVKSSHDIIYNEGLISEAVQDKDDIKNGHSDIYEEGLISDAVQDKESIKNAHTAFYKEGNFSDAVQDKESIKDSHKKIYNPEYTSMSVEDEEAIKAAHENIYSK